jgi:small subunit ribosomal protein S20
MARTPSTMKFHRQSEKRRLVNRSRKSTIRTFTKKAVAAAEAGDHAAAAKYQKVVQGLVDRAAKGSTLHKNTAARRKARLAKRLNAFKAGGEAST